MDYNLPYNQNRQKPNSSSGENFAHYLLLGAVSLVILGIVTVGFVAMRISSEKKSSDEIAINTGDSLATADPGVIKNPENENDKEVLGDNSSNLNSAQIAAQTIPAHNSWKNKEFYPSYIGSSALNLIRNSSFEMASDGQPMAWNYQLDSTAGNTYRSAEGTRSGNFGLKFINAGTGNLGISQPDVKTVPGRTYTLSMYIKTTNTSSIIIRLGFWNEYLNAEGKFKDFTLFGTKDWTRISMTRVTPGFITDHKNEFPMIQIIGLNNDGAVYIDDIQLEEGKELTPFNSQVAKPSSYEIGDGSIIFNPNGDIIPSYNGRGTLGSATNRFEALFLTKTTIDKDGAIATSGSLTADSATFTSLNVNDNTILGTDSTDSVTFNASIASNITPLTDNTYDLGSTTNRWKTLHVGPGSVVVHNDTTDTDKVTLDFSGSTARLITNAATPLQLTTGSNEGLNIATSGNVGIGNTSPATALDVTGIGTFSGGTIIGAGTSYTGAGAVTLSSGGSAGLTIDSASAIITIASNDTTLARTAAGTYTIDLIDGANTTLALTNSGAGVGNFTADGSLTGVGVNATTGLLQGTGGFTLTGTTNINTSGSNATNIGTGTNTGTITIGNVSGGDLALLDANWNINGGGTATFADIVCNSASCISTGEITDNTIDFTDIADSLTLDAATSITQGSNSFSIINNGSANTIINLSSTGDFDVQDNGTTAFFVSDSGNVGIGTNAPGALLDINRTDVASDTELIDVRSEGFTQTISAGLTNARFNQFNQSTITAASAQTVTNAATLYVEGAPIAAGSASITNNYAFWVDSGTSRFDGAVSYGGQQTLTADSTTPSVSDGSNFITANTIPTAITNFTGGNNGQVIFIEVNDANTTYDCTASNLNCGASDITAAAGDVLTFIYNGTNWNLISWMDTSDTQTGADIAEYYISDEELNAGDVVSIDGDRAIQVKKNSKAYDETAVGIIATEPYLILGEKSTNTYPVALVGRVPVKIDPESAPIRAGDYITSSGTPGRAMKATSAGIMIGKALESWTPDAGKDKIMVFVNLSWVDQSMYIASNGQLINKSSISEKDLELPTVATTEESSSDVMPKTDEVSNFDAFEFNSRVASSSANIEVRDQVSEIKNQNVRLHEEIETLTKAVNLFTSNSSILGVASSSAELGFEDNNDLSVTGRTTLADVGITGAVNIGLLTIEGLSESDTAFASLNTTSGPLKLQSHGINGVDILDGKVVITPEGNMRINGTITIKKVEVDTGDTASASAGVITISEGQTEIDITTSALSENSLIFVTPERPVAAGAVRKENGVFTIRLENAPSSDLKVNWWIIN